MTRPVTTTCAPSCSAAADPPGAEVGVGGQRLAVTERLAGVEVREVELGDPGEQVVARDVRHRQVDAQPVGERADGVGARFRGEPAGVDDHLGALGSAMTDITPSSCVRNVLA